MLSRPALSAAVLCCLMLNLVAFGEDHKLGSVSGVPDGLSKPVASALDPAGFRVEGPDGPVCDIWLLKTLKLKAGFSPTLSVNYPFTPGQLLGALRVPKGKVYKDFRGQELAAGVYTLRYGQQPEDGNHIGTSETADFVLALPSKIDQSDKVIDGFDPLTQASAKSAGSTHPAIFSLLPAEEPVEKPSLVHDEDYEFWILNVPAKAADGKKVPVRLVTIGQSEA